MIEVLPFDIEKYFLTGEIIHSKTLLIAFFHPKTGQVSLHTSLLEKLEVGMKLS